MSQIIIQAYDPNWVDDFEVLGNQIRSAIGNSALRIDHIGSTSVPGLAAKSIIDLQITVADIEAIDYLQELEKSDFRPRPDITNDLLVGLQEDSPELKKRFVREPIGQRRAHIHIREAGRLNQRYPILFRDYLRAHAVVAKAYESVKRELAAHFPEDAESYYAIKDPYMDTIYFAAQQWAEQTKWEAGVSDA